MLVEWLYYLAQVTFKFSVFCISARVTISISDINDNAPELTSPTELAISEIRPPNTLEPFTVFEGRDRDLGLNGQILFSLAEDSSQFRVDADGTNLTDTMMMKRIEILCRPLRKIRMLLKLFLQSSAKLGCETLDIGLNIFFDCKRVFE